MTEPKESDRRVYPRGPIELKVEYKRVNTFFADYTKNISKGGTFIKTDKPLSIGTEFLFRLHVPALGEPLELKGKVKWVIKPEEATPTEPPGMGIRFVYSDDDHSREVQARVEDLMIESFGYDLYSKLMRTSTKRPSSPD